MGVHETDGSGEERTAAAIHARIGADRARPIRVHRCGGTRGCDRDRLDSLPVRPARHQPGRVRCDIRSLPLSDAGPLAPGVRGPDHHSGRRRVPPTLKALPLIFENSGLTLWKGRPRAQDHGFVPIRSAARRVISKRSPSAGDNSIRYRENILSASSLASVFSKSFKCKTLPRENAKARSRRMGSVRSGGSIRNVGSLSCSHVRLGSIQLTWGAEQFVGVVSGSAFCCARARAAWI